MKQFLLIFLPMQRLIVEAITIGGGRGHWLGGHHGECRARAYNGGPGAEPLVRG